MANKETIHNFCLSGQSLLCQILTKAAGTETRDLAICECDVAMNGEESGLVLTIIKQLFLLRFLSQTENPATDMNLYLLINKEFYER